jgi:hypothetical protein
MGATDYMDFEIQFRTAKQRSDDGLQSTHDVSATINGGGSWRGESVIDLKALGTIESDPAVYGQRLAELLLPPPLNLALARARSATDRPVRIRLRLETGQNGERGNHHLLRWERASLAANGQVWPLAITPTLPFSRYIPIQALDPDLSDDASLRLLLAFANPTGLPTELHPVDVETALAQLLDELTPLVQTKRFKLTVMPGRASVSEAMHKRLADLDAEVITGFTQRETIASALERCQGLHLVAHGMFNPDSGHGALLLEDATGARVFARDDELNAWFNPGLRFVVLQACQSAVEAPPGGPPLAGIAPQLVALGVPAVVAMQDFVPMDDAGTFAATFYRSLMRNGIVDSAVNDGRQALFRKKQDDSYTIPVLFMRLRSGLLWSPDPLRIAVRARLSEIDRDSASELPLRAILSLRHDLEYDPDVGPPGALFDMPAKLAQVCEPDTACVVLVGSRGMAKGAQLRWLYRTAAERFLDDDATAPAPVMLTAREILEQTSVSTAIDHRLSANLPAGTRVDWKNRPLLLIVDGDEEIGEDQQAEVLARLNDFLKRTPQRLVLTLDERTKHIWNTDIQPTAVLVTRPMEFERVLKFLKQQNTDEAQQLLDVVERRQCRDIAGTPWLLERMVSLTARRVTFDSRATLLGRIASECFTTTPSAGIPRQSAERALEQIAWTMQSARTPALGGGELYDILSRARGNREFRMADLLNYLIQSSVLALAGEDAVRFRYQSLQAYYAARHLIRLPAAEQQRVLEDITASLGRLSRARWWEKTLITLTGLEASARERILNTILAGSPLVEGEQVYIAARCYVDTRNPDEPPNSVVDQLADALIWRSHPGNLRPYADRRRAALALSELRHPNAVPHFVSLAAEQIAPGWTVGKRYDFSGIRLIATKGLLLMREVASEHVQTHKPELASVIYAWWQAYESSDVTPLIEILRKNDAATSPIAAFALALFDSDAARQPLIAAFGERRTDRDVGWAVADALATLDPVWVTREVIEPRLGKVEDPRVPYLIGRTGMAGEYPKLREYLDQCIRTGAPAVQARAIRALGELKDPGVKPLCEAIALEDWQKAKELGLKVPASPDPEDLSRLSNASFESLRSVGDLTSVEALRKARQSPSMTITLRQLSFDVAEEIYWQITGGLSRETFDPTGRPATSERRP